MLKQNNENIISLTLYTSHLSLVLSFHILFLPPNADSFAKFFVLFLTDKIAEKHIKNAFYEIQTKNTINEDHTHNLNLKISALFPTILTPQLCRLVYFFFLELFFNRPNQPVSCRLLRKNKKNPVAF